MVVDIKPLLGLKKLTSLDLSGNTYLEEKALKSFPKSVEVTFS
jgi:Leucine-rich repeat (LRR) protein